MDTARPHDGTTGRPDDLGVFLREARIGKGLELSDIAEITHVRKEYLRALEEGRYEALPEDIYARNFVRLFAQAVGVNEKRALELFASERRRGGAADAAPAPSRPAARAVPAKVGKVRAKTSTPQEDLGLMPETAPQPSYARPRRPLRFGAWLPTLILIAAVVGLGLWAFNSLLFPRTLTPAPSEADTAEVSVGTPETAAEPADLGAAATPAETVSLSLSTTPPGADVMVDGFSLASTTPIANYPITPGPDRSLRVSLAGYEVYETDLDLTQDANLDIMLTPEPAEGAVAAGAGEAAASEPPAAAENQLTVRIEETTWLEAFASTERNQGERLAYATVQPGQSFTFPLPVYLHVGNAAGVRVWVGEEDRGLMGSSGEVVSRAFTQ